MRRSRSSGCRKDGCRITSSGFLSLTKAPLGSVSVNVWAFACASVIAMVSEALMAVWTLRAGEVKEGPRKGEKIKMEAVGTGSVGTGEKKEL